MKGHKLGGNFTFTAKRIEHLGATEYTLVTVAVDETGSVSGFKDQLLAMLQAAVGSCKRSPRSDNLLVRVIYFSDKYANGVKEIHGFKPLAEIDPAQYPLPVPGGWTPLCDAVYSAIGAMNTYGKELYDRDYLANGIGFIITDGGENMSVATMSMVKAELAKSVTGEILESMVSIVIGVNTQVCGASLDHFTKEAGITTYIDAGDVSEKSLAKIANFVSRSVSSQSQSLGTGGPSQHIAATI
jgi:hypothetical protein